MALTEKNNPSRRSWFKPFLPPLNALTKFIIPVFLVWASITTVSPQRLVKGNLKLSDVMSNYAQDLHNIPELTMTLSRADNALECPGINCPLNLEARNESEKFKWEEAKNYLTERADTDSWRGVHYSRIDTKLPKFASKKGEKVAFDILGIAGKSWRFFVNGVEKASGEGGFFANSIIFESDGGTPGEPLVVGFEVQSGRTFAPGIIYLSQPFLSPPEIAPVIRTAYRGNDKEVVLPDAYARATLAVIVALGCLFTPYHLEILFFAAGITMWNYMRLATNEMAPFPAFLGVDFTTLYAAMLCLFNAASLAFLALYFRVKSRSVTVLCLVSTILAPLCILAGKSGYGINLITFSVNNEYLLRGLIELAGVYFAFTTWKATRTIQKALFRKYIALIFILVLSAAGCLSIALQSSMWGFHWIDALQTTENRWLARKLIEVSMASFGIAIALEWALVVHDRQTVLKRFGMMVDPRVLKEIIRSHSIPSIRAERVVGLFVDLRGFTALCEKESPQEVNLTLNEYLDVITTSVEKNSGIIDKFVGDEVMALWGVPEQSVNDPMNSIHCAMDIRKGMQELNKKRRSQNRTELSYGIGIHCGPAVVGPVGTSNRIDYTAIGPTINLAARLQSLTKDKRVDILISSELYSLVQSATLVSDLGATKVQGIDKPVGVFRLLGAVDRKGQFHFYDNKLEAANLPHGPGTNDQAPENLFKAS